MRTGYRKRTTAGDKTIGHPWPEGVVYDEWIEDSEAIGTIWMGKSLRTRNYFHPRLAPHRRG